MIHSFTILDFIEHFPGNNGAMVINPRNCPKSHQGRLPHISHFNGFCSLESRCRKNAYNRHDWQPIMRIRLPSRRHRCDNEEIKRGSQQQPFIRIAHIAAEYPPHRKQVQHQQYDLKSGLLSHYPRICLGERDRPGYRALTYRYASVMRAVFRRKQIIIPSCARVEYCLKEGYENPVEEKPVMRPNDTNSLRVHVSQTLNLTPSPRLRILREVWLVVKIWLLVTDA